MSASRSLTCDVAVIGAGPAGIAAAARAAESGARVIIVDSGARPGGQIWRHRDVNALPPLARRWLARLGSAGQIEWLLQGTVVDGDLARGLKVITSDGTARVNASKVIIATGARELFLPYPGWTLPNVMGIGGAQAMLKGGLDVRGKRVIIAGSGPLLLPVAAAMTSAGATLVAVAEQASARQLAGFAVTLWSQPAKLLLAARYRLATPLRIHRMGTWVERADGNGRVQTVTLTTGHRRWTEQCDLLCCSYGLVPGIELARLLGCEITDGRVVVDRMQKTTVPGVYGAGETTGVAGDAAAIAEGEIAGLAAAMGESAVVPSPLHRRQEQGQRFARRLRTTFRPRDAIRTLATPDTIVCRCEDVRLGALDASWTGRQAKLYTRAGMGPCQGAVCGPALEQLFGWSSGTVRPPLFAPPLGAWIAGDSEAGVSTDSPT